LPRLPPMFAITFDLCGRKFGTLLNEIDVRGLTLQAICETCANAVTQRKLPESLGEWNEAITRAVSKPTK